MYLYTYSYIYVHTHGGCTHTHRCVCMYRMCMYRHIGFLIGRVCTIVVKHSVRNSH